MLLAEEGRRSHQEGRLWKCSTEAGISSQCNLSPGREATRSWERQHRAELPSSHSEKSGLPNNFLTTLAASGPSTGSSLEGAQDPLVAQMSEDTCAVVLLARKLRYLSTKHLVFQNTSSHSCHTSYVGSFTLGAYWKSKGCLEQSKIKRCEHVWLLQWKTRTKNKFLWSKQNLLPQHWSHPEFGHQMSPLISFPTKFQV